ncbi:MAG: GspE/PulE family protein [Candidatus Omnitrophota bacterium]
MAKSLVDKLIQTLLKKELLTEKDLKKAKDIQNKIGGTLSAILRKEKIVDENDLISTMSSVFDIPAVNLENYDIEKEAVNLIPERISRKYMVVGICKLSGTLVLAMADPLNIFAIDEVKMITKLNIEAVLSTETDILNTINKFYASQESTFSDILKDDKEADVEVIAASEEEFDLSGAVSEGEAPPIVKIVDLVLIEALRKRASDIHIEPEERSVRVRYRVDGALHDALKIPKKNQNAVLARLKIMSGMDITESRLPQDGRFKIRIQKREVDFRVSALPTSFGSKIVLRALDKANLSVGLGKLGFSEYALSKFKEAIVKPFGMILVTGPTGSGKSTTLYSILNQLNTPEKNIITIEDPVEYQVEGITQIQVNSDIGLSFVTGLRSLLRQSPDVIMVGEIRDSETADIAIKASLTGQLVLSTLHTNDSASAIARLVDMGVEPFLISSSVILIVAQRLCRVACSKCKGKAEGCKECSFTGYKGRNAILEVLDIDDEVRARIIDRVSTDDIKEYAVSKGMKTLREEAMEKYKQHITTLEEVMRVTSED